MDDTQLVAGLQAGNREAALALLDRFEKPLLRYFEVSLPDMEAAADAVQEVLLRFIRAARERGQGGEPIRSCHSFIFAIAHRLLIDQQREHSRRPPMLSLDSIPRTQAAGAEDGGGRRGAEAPSLAERIRDAKADPREVAARREMNRRVSEAIRSLDPEIREVIVLHHIEGMSGREVARALQIPETTVWSRLHKGLEILRQKLAPYSPEGRAPETPVRPGRRLHL